MASSHGHITVNQIEIKKFRCVVALALLQKNPNGKSKIQKNLVNTEALTELLMPLALKSVERHLQQVKKDLLEVVLFAYSTFQQITMATSKP